MAIDSNGLVWLHSLGKSEDFPIWFIVIIAFMQTKGLYKTLIGSEDIIRRPNNLPENPPDALRAARDSQRKEHTIKVEQKKNRDNIL